MRAVTQPRAVVAGEDDEGVVIEAVLFQRVENLPDGPVNLLNHVAVKARAGLALELVTHEEGHVRHRVREVEEEGPVLVLGDELHRALGIPRRQVRLLLRRDVGVNHLVALDERQGRIRALLRLRVMRPHVVGVRQAEVFVEAVPHREELRMMAEVPLARHAGRVTLLLEDLGHRHFVRVDTDARTRPERTVNADAVVVTAGEQRGA